MSASSQRRSEEFLQISGQFKLGALVTESSHPVTANLSEVAKTDIAAALDLLFEADGDVVNKFRVFAASGHAEKIAAVILASIKSGGKIFFTGCGSTGRLSILLDSIWRDFWQKRQNSDLENRTFSVMAGGDYALIKSVEGFEDFTAFGEKQITDLSLSAKDVVFAITEGGETSFVIGTAWAGVKAGAKVYFVYNNPDDILCEHVQRSREVIQDERLEKINLTTGPMSITGSTRMQATSIQLCVMLTVLEIVVRKLTGQKTIGVANEFLAQLKTLHVNLRSPEFLLSLAKLVKLEESVYRGGGKNNYFADRLGADVLTDTTERSPTYCTPPFRKFDDTTATESWAYLFLPEPDAASAWRSILKRKPRCVEWSDVEIRALVGEDKFPRTQEIIRKISATELMRFRIGFDGISFRPFASDNSTIVVFCEQERDSWLKFETARIEIDKQLGAKTSVLYFGMTNAEFLNRLCSANDTRETVTVIVRVPQANFLLNGITRVAVKLVMNALSTCTMVRLGRVMGNYMVWVVPSNLKLIDRATRYISKLTDLPYERANGLLFEIIEYVEPRMKADQTYPPVVGMAVVRAKNDFTNEQAERFLQAQ